MERSILIIDLTSRKVHFDTKSAILEFDLSQTRIVGKNTS